MDAPPLSLSGGAHVGGGGAAPPRTPLSVRSLKINNFLKIWPSRIGITFKHIIIEGLGFLRGLDEKMRRM